MPKPFPREFREDVIRVARNREPGVRIKDVAADFGISESCLQNWTLAPATASPTHQSLSTNNAPPSTKPSPLPGSTSPPPPHSAPDIPLSTAPSTSTISPTTPPTTPSSTPPAKSIDDSLSAPTNPHILVRPDGHIAHRATGNDLESLNHYLTTWFPRP